MAESDEFQSKRSKHEERLSRVFDEVMGLGQYADSSRGSATSSSSGQEDSKEVEESLGLGELTGKEDGNGSGQEQRKDDKDTSPPPVASPSSDRRSPSTSGTSRAGGADFDDTLDGLPVYGAEDEEEDWHFSLPMATLDDINMDKTDDSSQPDDRNTDTRDELFDSVLKEGEHEKEEQRPVNSERNQDGANSSTHTETSQQGEKSVTAPVEDCNPPPPVIENIKDEPIDEGYDAALLPQSSISQIKEELENQEEELRISSVYSVGGGNTFTPPTAPGPAPQTPANVIPGRMAMPLLKPIAPMTYLSSPMALPVSQPAPLPPAPSGVRCSGCAKILMKGQTAFQRKGSTQLFCSTVCLTGHLPPTSKARCCFQCHKEITQPKDMIMIPINATMYLNFCSHFCLSEFKNKRKTVEPMPVKLPDKRLEKHPEKQPEKQPEQLAEIIYCSVCRGSAKIEHEVTHQGLVYKLCSNACFMSWRKMRHLAMNCCEGCGLYCKSDSGSCQTISVDKCQLNFCSPTCISTYKQNCRKMTECGNCHKTAVVSSTIMEVGVKGKVQLYCSVACVEKSRPPKHALAGALFPCSHCKRNAVPEYHLAMVDGNILNFCSYECISIYRIKLVTPVDRLTKCQPESNSAATPSSSSALTEPPYRPGPSRASVPNTGSAPAPPNAEFPSSASCPGHHRSHSSVPPLVPPPVPPPVPPVASGHAQVARGRPPAGPQPMEDVPDHLLKLTCQECKKLFTNKPVLFSYQGLISMFCDKMCCDGYKTKKKIIAVCQTCKEEKVVYDVVNYNEQELVICSEKCKLLFKEAMTASYKEQPCRACNYCDSLGHKMLHSHYRGSMVEFCKPHCMSQYTVLYYGMARCDRCKKQISVAEKLQCSGSVRNFCDLRCLLQYCYQHFENNQQVTSNGTGTGPALPPPHAPSRPQHLSEMNPVIADVVSLASDSATQPSEAVDGAVTGALPSSNTLGKNLYNASTQTDATRVPASRRRQMKNKSVLCRPFTVDQETLCQLPAPATESTACSTNTPADLASAPHPDQPSTDAHHLPARLTGRHFLGRREKGSLDCKVCSQHKRKRVEKEDGREEKKKRKMAAEEEKEEVAEVGAHKTPDQRKEEGRLDDEEEEERKEGRDQVKDREVCEEEEETERSQTWYFCKTCPGEPSLCPAPCFELYHTQLIYRLAPDLQTQALSLSSSEERVKVVMVPIVVPVFIPVPMNMYSQHTPVPVAVPLPVPVPIVIPKENKEVKDAAVQSEPLAEAANGEKDKPVSHAGPCGNHSSAVEPEAERPTSLKDDRSHREGAVTQDSPQETADREDAHAGCEETPVAPSTEGPASSQPVTRNQAEGSTEASDTPGTSEAPRPSPQMDLENDFPPELLLSAPQRGVKRPRESSSGRKRARRRTGFLDRRAMVSHGRSKLNHLYGVKAWKSWVAHPDRAKDLAVKEDILQCDSTELSHGLCRFIREVQRPNGESYTPDSIFYLCLGIQQYLFEKGRIENIFTDELYSPFSMEITAMLQHGRPKSLPTGGVVTSRVEEAYLWDCKQLGAYSPLVLLNTLLYFCTKSFQLTTPEQHRRVSFMDLTRHSRPCSRVGKTCYLRYRRTSTGPSDQDLDQKDTEYSKKGHRQVEEDKEMPENITNPLQCPVRLYEFYLSRCPEPAKKRKNLFYLQPLKTVNTNSPHWYTSQPLKDSTLQSMLTRILAVREVQLETAEQH